MINRANAAARAANKENAAAISEFEAQVQRLHEGRIWARVREEATKRMQAEEARRVLQEQVDQHAAGKRAVEPQPEGRQGAAESGEPALPLQGVRREGRELRKFFELEPMAAEIEERKAENQRLRDKITELKGITKPGKKYFHDDGFTLAVDLAIAEAITTAH
eukprot:3269850-Pleurochrysis_carterae.AAC.1